MSYPQIWFPHLDIRIYDLPRVAFSVFGWDIYWYGIIVFLATATGYMVAIHTAKKTGQNPDLYTDYLLIAFPICALGARLYFIIFSSHSITQLFNFRIGGVAIYGLVIAALLTAIVYCKMKKMSFFVFTDTAIAGLVIGQVIGR